MITHERAMMNETTSLIGERLREVRANLDISLDEAARMTGVSKPMLGQIERGQSIPTITTLWKIATGLKTPLSSFLQERQPEYTTIGIYDEPPVQRIVGRCELIPFSLMIRSEVWRCFILSLIPDVIMPPRSITTV